MCFLYRTRDSRQYRSQRSLDEIILESIISIESRKIYQPNLHLLPFVEGDRRRSMTDAAPALSPLIVTREASPLKASIFR
jgi:hypothetical protein